MKFKLHFDAGVKIDTNLHEGTLTVTANPNRFRMACGHFSDNQRLELIKTLIEGARYPFDFIEKAKKLVASDKIKEILE